MTATRFILAASAVLSLSLPAGAATLSRRASITGGGGDGKCTIEVDVDGAADVEVAGDMGYLRTLSGETATWKRFVCNQAMPRNPGDFRFRGIDGRGHVELIRDPRGGGGSAVVRIEDPKGGREGYTFDLEWRGAHPGYEGGGGRTARGGAGRAIETCQEAVESRIYRMGYRDVRFQAANADDRPGRYDWIVGVATARKGFTTHSFRFGCSVDFSSGRVRSVEVDRR
ncbi:MAG: hypothetical protein HY235_24700 [Acidobacteria bacterium]|nr:hypothetical protein [Acidobacteriota bacterium]